MTAPSLPRPPAWPLLEQAIVNKLVVRARYHGHDRVLSPHALGWKKGRPKLLAYQADGTTSHGALPPDPHQRWRSMFVDEIQDAVLTDGPWVTATNRSPQSNGIDDVEIQVDCCSHPRNDLRTRAQPEETRSQDFLTPTRNAVRPGRQRPPS